MPLFSTESLRPSTSLAPFDREQIYNGLDCCLTFEVEQEIERTYEDEKDIWGPIYSFERALQAPYLSIMRKGFCVNGEARRIAANELRERILALQKMLDTLAEGVWNTGLNPNSPKQLCEFFYGPRGLRLPEQWIRFKGVARLSTGREALEKLDQYLFARPFCNIILLIRDLKKQLEIFETEIDPDGRFRSSYNIPGTETGRPSSSSNAFGTGRNAQNIAANLRWPFEADEGFRMAVIDLEQVEARDVGFFIGCLFDDWTFLNNCESGDLHTNNCKLIWPLMPWTGAKGPDRALADQIFFREFSFRDMSKRGGHLSNYYGTAWTMARSLKIPLKVAEEFQALYCRGGEIDGRARAPAFPGIPRWWGWTAEQLQTRRQLTTPFGRRRHFFGRPSDDATLREAIAFLPQSTTADRMNLGLWRVWRHVPEVQLLAQTYDSITFQYRESENEAELLSRILDLLRVELFAPNGRSYIVPGEAKVGWNWGSEVTLADQQKAQKNGKKIPRLNLDGLRKWSPGKKDERARSARLSFLSSEIE